jgi:transcriptional regulator with XRE-family HTH domain
MRAKLSDQRALESRKATDVDTHVGKRLRQRRLIRGLSQRDLAVRVGISPQQLQKYEIGQNRITAARLYSCAEALDVPVWSFYLGLPGAGSREQHGARSERPSARSEALPNLLDMIDDNQLREQIISLVEAFSARLRKS